MSYLDTLNEKQFEAVTTPSQITRVVAGAGSGKTRVLTYRIAYLLNEMNVCPWNILAFTFTNKAANEMRNRATKLCPDATGHLVIKTFHSFAAMFLRREISVLGYPSNFTILDEEDQTKMIKDIAADMGYKRTDPVVKRAMSYISKNKLLELYPEDIVVKYESFPDEKTCLKIYETYEFNKLKMLALDFDDLLLKTNVILENYELIREKWQSRIDHILIDEFQDTNNVEYRMISFLRKPDCSLYVVGDPDQTIYTWRGANHNIIMSLQKQFPFMETIVLDRNYRSTQNILDAANRLIGFNKMRVPKNLYTENNKGKDVVLKSCASSREEANFVARTIKQLHEVNQKPFSDFVVLYRSSYVTQEFEQAFAQYRIPYRIYGGLKFYQRREIKDIIAYFRLISNVKDDISFERIINVPKRNIGDTTLNKYKLEAKAAGLSMYEYLRSIKPEDSEAPKKATNTLQTLIYKMDRVRDDINDDKEIFTKILEDFVYDIGYREYLLKEEDGDDRVDNVNALFEDIKHFLKEHPEAKFEEYLQNISLISGQDEVDSNGDMVTMMTVHTAKGLEFPVVFIVRLNETVFPHTRSLMESGSAGLEEERRLCYVAMTRAMNELYISFSNDFSYVSGGKLTPSQFIKQAGLSVPVKVVSEPYTPSRPVQQRRSFFDDGPNLDFEADTPSTSSQSFSFDKPTNGINWKIGDICVHRRFGRGVVVAIDGGGIITVNFDSEGKKELMGSHPALSKGGNDA